METEELYISGFNSGYLLAEHTPALVQQVIPSLCSGTAFTDGLTSGTQQYYLDRENRELIALQNLRNNNLYYERDLE